MDLLNVINQVTTSGTVHIIIVNYKTPDDTIACVQSILSSTYRNFSIHVIDNASGDDSDQKLDEFVNSSGLEQVHYYGLKENLGFAGGNNYVLRKLINDKKKEKDRVWLLNPDMMVENTTLSALVECHASEDEGRDVVVGLITKSFLDRSKTLNWGGAIVNPYTGTVRFGENIEEHTNGFVSGNSLFTGVEVFRKYGLLPEAYFLYWEETCWNFSVKRGGGKLVICKSAVAYDKISTSIGKGRKAFYYYTRNALYFVHKHFGRIHVLLVLMLIPLRILFKLVRFDGGAARGILAGTRDYLRNRTGKM